MADDYYKTLEIQRGASDDEIHGAYRKLARKYHPDLNPDDNAAKKKFQEIQQAYEVLKDPKKREMFDRYGPGFESMSGGGGGPWRANPQSRGHASYEDVDLGDIFGEQFGGGEGGGFSDLFRQFTRRGGRSGQRPMKGKDVLHEITVPLRTTVTGGSAQLSIRRPNGKLETIDVKIPAGIEDGKKIRLRGQGETAPGGVPPGDMLITVRVAAHPCYSRQGSDLIVRVPISVIEAVNGTKVDIPTPKGTITMTVPPGTSSGKRLRAKGHGVATAEKTGDLLAEIQIVLPETIDASTKSELAKLDLTPSGIRDQIVW